MMAQMTQGVGDSKAMVEQALRQLKRNATAVVISFLILSSGTIIGVSLLKNVFVATTTILVDPQKIPERYVTTTVTSDPGSRLTTLTQLVLSATKLQEIIDRLNLYPERRVKESHEELLDYVRSKIKIEVKSGSEAGLSSFTISYEDNDRFIVAPMANQLAATFIDWNNKVRKQQALGTSEFLSGEVLTAKKSLEEQEARLKAFRTEHSGETPEDLDGNMQALSGLQVELQASLDATNRLDEERILLTQTSRPREFHEKSDIGERSRLLEEKERLENQLWQLRQQFTDKYPDVIAASSQLKAVDELIKAMPAPPTAPEERLDENSRVRLTLINRDLQRQKQQQGEIQKKMADYQAKVQAVPGLQMQLSDLSRNYEASKQNYQTLLDKSFSAGMAQDLESQQAAEHFTALDTARTPEKPVKPKRLPLMGVGVLMSLLLSVGGAVAFTLLSGAVGSEEQLRGLLPPKTLILGTIPCIESKYDRRKTHLLLALTASFVVIDCVAVSLFLTKVRPVL